ncbi:hypothetical protein EI77_00112 [Prosthecobacter fusiformis]|uniref:Trehalose utilization protein n=1 Tax=Prosthecobacter fusiformis TaxID=48464 RepID=A0A4R7SPH2_9BACT|nr:hypothetical protein [Prosthecobacter fusiformis]TDU80814.1 hypothetical protein EI77_00112 [Prosthecobacter fusiformis]
MIRRTFLILVAVLPLGASFAAEDFLAYEPKGEAKGKHVVLLAGDEEYRSEEALPMLAKLLSERHGFKTTVLFSVGEDGTVDPTKGESLTNPAALDSADALVLLLRFRHWDEATLDKFDAAVKRGVPIIALRTSTHAFSGIPKDSKHVSWNWNNEGGWGEKVLGETWVSHWGHHKFEATQGVIETAHASDPLLRGVTDVFGTSDVYEAYPPADAKILMRGRVLKGMTPDSGPLETVKARATDKKEQPVNDPMMAIAWTRSVKNDAGSENKVLTTTMGAATDLTNESLRRLVVNSVYWGLGIEVPEKADVTLVGEYNPTAYGFKGYKQGVKVMDLK